MNQHKCRISGGKTHFRHPGFVVKGLSFHNREASGASGGIQAQAVGGGERGGQVGRGSGL